MRTLSILLLACGAAQPADSTLATVTVHVAAPNRLSLAASVLHPTDGGLPDGGFFWRAGDGEAQDVVIGSAVNWSLVSEVGAQLGDDSCTGEAFVGDAGLDIAVAFDGGTCAHSYE